MVFVLPQVGAVFALIMYNREEREKGRRVAALAYFACALLWLLLWLAAVGYCGYRAYLAIP